MPEDYAAAARRHFRDATLLEQNHRVANADQLFGFAAECAIKRALTEVPGFLDGGGLAKAYRKHVNDLWDRARHQSLQKGYPNLVALLKATPHPFHDWSPDQRYEPDGGVPDEAIRRHRRAAARILGSVGLYGSRAEI